MIPLKIVIVFNKIVQLEKGERYDILSERGVLSAVNAVYDSVIGMGMIVEKLGVTDNYSEFIKRINELRPDLVFNLCESIMGNSLLEKVVPEILDSLKISYTGSNSYTIECCLNKAKAKEMLLSKGINTPAYSVCKKVNDKPNLKFPLIVKPLHEDGGLGIDRKAVVFSDKRLVKRIRYILDKYKQPVLVEEYIDGREFNVAIIGNCKPIALPISEIDYSSFPDNLPKICSYQAKWIEGSFEYLNTKPICPAPLNKKQKRLIIKEAIKAYKCMGCKCYARVDMRIGDNGIPYIIEVNPNPDISPGAGIIRSAEKAGMSYDKFIKKIIRYSLLRKKKK